MKGDGRGTTRLDSRKNLILEHVFGFAIEIVDNRIDPCDLVIRARLGRFTEQTPNRLGNESCTIRRDMVDLLRQIFRKVHLNTHVSNSKPRLRRESTDTDGVLRIGRVTVCAAATYIVFDQNGRSTGAPFVRAASRTAPATTTPCAHGRRPETTTGQTGAAVLAPVHPRCVVSGAANGSHAKLCGRSRVPKPKRRGGCRQ